MWKHVDLLFQIDGTAQRRANYPSVCHHTISAVEITSIICDFGPVKRFFYLCHAFFESFYAILDDRCRCTLLSPQAIDLFLQCYSLLLQLFHGIALCWRWHRLIVFQILWCYLPHVWIHAIHNTEPHHVHHVLLRLCNVCNEWINELFRTLSSYHTYHFSHSFPFFRVCATNA